MLIWITYFSQVHLSKNTSASSCHMTLHANGLSTSGPVCNNFPPTFKSTARTSPLFSSSPNFTCQPTSKNVTTTIHSILLVASEGLTAKLWSVAGLISTQSHHLRSKWGHHLIVRLLMIISAIGIGKGLLASVSIYLRQSLIYMF